MDYYFTSKNAGLSNGVALGGQFGFGFGEYIGLSATYLKSMDLNTDFGSLENGLQMPANKPASLERVGGEFQINLSSGAGLAFRLHDRINLALQAVHSAYRINTFTAYLSSAERAALTQVEIPASADYVSDLMNVQVDWPLLHG